MPIFLASEHRQLHFLCFLDELFQIQILIDFPNLVCLAKIGGHLNFLVRIGRGRPLLNEDAAFALLSLNIVDKRLLAGSVRTHPICLGDLFVVDQALPLLLLDPHFRFDFSDCHQPPSCVAFAIQILCVLLIFNFVEERHCIPSEITVSLVVSTFCPQFSLRVRWVKFIHADLRGWHQGIGRGRRCQGVLALLRFFARNLSILFLFVGFFRLYITHCILIKLDIRINLGWIFRTALTSVMLGPVWVDLVSLGLVGACASPHGGALD